MLFPLQSYLYYPDTPVFYQLLHSDLAVQVLDLINGFHVLCRNSDSPWSGISGLPAPVPDSIQSVPGSVLPLLSDRCFHCKLRMIFFRSGCNHHYQYSGQVLHRIQRVFLLSPLQQAGATAVQYLRFVHDFFAPL